MTFAKKTKIPKAKTLREAGKPTFLSKNKYILLSFLLPFALMTVAYAWADVAPFGILNTMVESIGFHLHKISEYGNPLGFKADTCCRPLASVLSLPCRPAG